MTGSSLDLPRVVSTAMCIAIGGFVLMNIALFAVLPFELLRERSAFAVVWPLYYIFYSISRTAANSAVRSSVYRFSLEVWVD